MMKMSKRERTRRQGWGSWWIEAKKIKEEKGSFSWMGSNQQPKTNLAAETWRVHQRGAYFVLQKSN